MGKKVFLLALLLTLVFVSGCTFTASRGDQVQTEKEPTVSESAIPDALPLTLDEVKRALLTAGLNLTAADSLKPADYTVNDRQPVIFTLHPGRHLLLLYAYPTIAERVDAGQQLTGSVSAVLPVPENWLTRGYAAKNFVLVDMVDYGDAFSSNQDRSLVSSELITDSVTETARLKKAVAALNGGKTATFSAAGDFWDAGLTVSYFQYWYKDSSGTLHIAQDSQGEWNVKYLGSNPVAIKSFSYEYTSPNGSGSGSENEHGNNILRPIGSSYYLPLSTSSNMGIPAGDTVYTLKIKWNDHSENLTLKPAQS